jgi:hypothetical protein
MYLFIVKEAVNVLQTKTTTIPSFWLSFIRMFLLWNPFSGALALCMIFFIRLVRIYLPHLRKRREGHP